MNFEPNVLRINKVAQFASGNAEAVFLVMLGTSSFPAGHEVYKKSIEKFVPSWERALTQND